jgi:hypothetical protein
VCTLSCFEKEFTYHNNNNRKKRFFSVPLFFGSCGYIEYFFWFLFFPLLFSFLLCSLFFSHYIIFFFVSQENMPKAVHGVRVITPKKVVNKKVLSPSSSASPVRPTTGVKNRGVGGVNVAKHISALMTKRLAYPMSALSSARLRSLTVHYGIRFLRRAAADQLRTVATNIALKLLSNACTIRPKGKITSSDVQIAMNIASDTQSHSNRSMVVC